MRNFMITLAVSTVATLVLWQFGFAAEIWPAHPFLTSLLIAVGCGIAVQLLLSRRRPTRDSGL